MKQGMVIDQATFAPGRTVPVVQDDRVSLHVATDVLALGHDRLFRLGRFLGLAPSDPCLPREIVLLARTEPDADTRYQVLRDWLLTDLRTRKSVVPEARHRSAV